MANDLMINGSRDRIREALEELLSGKGVPVGAPTVGLERGGTKVTIPTGMQISEAIAWLERQRKAEEEVMRVQEQIPGFAADGLVAFHKVLAKTYGWVEAVPAPGFFGPTPPQSVTVETSPGKTVSLAYGDLKIPGIDGTVSLQLGNGMLWIQGQVRGRSVEALKALIVEARAVAARESIYRGQAIKTAMDGSAAPRFVDTSGVDAADLVLTRASGAAVRTSLWTPITHSEEARRWGVPLKRGILLSGPYGTGKSLTATVTAKLCAASGWTFIYLEDLDMLADAMTLARHYAPAVLFAEDIDRLVTGERTEAMDDVLNTLDGVDGKGKEVIVVFTTNDATAINPAMLRPGRLDAVIEIGPPDAEAAARLLERYSRGLASEGCSFAEAGALVAGMVPAAIREVVERAKLAAIGNGHSEIQGTDLEQAALAMSSQQKLFTRKLEANPIEDLTDAFQDLVEGAAALRLIKAGHGKVDPAGCGNPVCPVHGS